MNISTDWHIHTQNSCDSAALLVADLVKEAEAAGIKDYGITDHIHTPFNLPDLVNSRREFESCQPSSRFHFGVEVSCVSQWELDELASGRAENKTYGLRDGGPAWAEPAIGISKRDLDALRVEYVVGGTHWPLYVPLEREAIIRDYHRQNMFLAAHPLVDIVAHPWWWHKHWQSESGKYEAEPWFDDFRVIPQSMHDEFAAASIQNGKKIEINIGGMLLTKNYQDGFKRQYLEYLAGLKEKGVAFALGSDCHSEHYDTDFEKAARMMEKAGITEDELWVLPPRKSV